MEPRSSKRSTLIEIVVGVVGGLAFGTVVVSALLWWNGGLGRVKQFLGIGPEGIPAPGLTAWELMTLGIGVAIGFRVSSIALRRFSPR